MSPPGSEQDETGSRNKSVKLLKLRFETKSCPNAETQLGAPVLLAEGSTESGRLNGILLVTGTVTLHRYG